MDFNNFGNEKPTEVDGGGRSPGDFGIARQSSIYSLTFDEFQNAMGASVGKDFGSMNMDELLKSIWSAEETQIMGSAPPPTATAAASASAAVGGFLQKQGSLTLPRTLSQKTVDQVWKDVSKEYGNGSIVGVPNFPQRQPTLREMTLEEFLVKAGVVREDNHLVEKPNNVVGFLGDSYNNNNSQGIGFPQNNGLMMGTGKVAESNNNQSYNNNGLGIGFQQTIQNNNGLMGNRVPESGNQTQNAAIQSPNQTWNLNGFRPTQQETQQKQTQIFPKQSAFGFANLGSPDVRRGTMGIADSSINTNLVQSGVMQGGGGMGMVGLGAGALTVKAGSPAVSSDGLGKSNGDISSVSPVPYIFNGNLRGRKRSSGLEKVVERRQRRMIKNRESAARSRARKQAYTTELEEEVAKLKEDNQELRKKQAEILEMQKNKVLEMMNMQQGAKRRRLRRTQTGPW